MDPLILLLARVTLSGISGSRLQRKLAAKISALVSRETHPRESTDPRDFAKTTRGRRATANTTVEPSVVEFAFQCLPSFITERHSPQRLLKTRRKLPRAAKEAKRETPGSGNRNRELQVTAD